MLTWQKIKPSVIPAKAGIHPRWCILGFLVCALLLAVAGPVSVASTSTANTPQGSYERGIIEFVGSGQTESAGSISQTEVFHVRFLSGPFDGQSRDVVNELSSNPYDTKFQTGDKIVLFVQAIDGGAQHIYIAGYDRRAAIFWLVVLFALTLIVLSGWQGVKVVASIGISILLIAYVLIPSFLRGVNPVPVAILLGGVLTLISTAFSTGWNRKSYVTAIGTMGGALVAYLVSLAFASWGHVSGLATEEDRMFFGNNPSLNPRGLLFAGIIIASVGVVEDVAVSIVSGIAEVKKHKLNASYRDLFQSGMTVGRDHMGALANTLVFAYVGASLSTLLLYQQFDGSWLKFINFDNVVDEILRSLAGTIGLVFTVPMTAVLAAWAMRPQDGDGVRGHHHGHD